jgi:hypothetical protein
MKQEEVLLDFVTRLSTRTSAIFTSMKACLANIIDTAEVANWTEASIMVEHLERHLDAIAGLPVLFPKTPSA